jgi:predicted dehydrogenase
MERLRVGILGCGAVAGFHAGRLATLDEVRIVGLVDPNPQSIERLRQRVSLDGVPAFAEPAELYKAAEVDAVVIATPHTLHHPMIMRALERGLHVLCEKPLACTPEEARDIAGAAAASGLTVTIGYQRHFDPGYLYMRDVIERGDLGELRAVSITCGQHWDEWTRSGWRQVPELSGGGMLMDTGSHMVDLLCWLVGRPFVHVRALVENRGRPVDIDTTAMVAFEGGVQAQLMVLGDMPFAWLESVVVTGTKAALRYENDPQHPWRPGQVARLSEETETRPLNLRTGNDDVVTSWLAAIRGRGENPIPPAAGIRVAELTRAIVEAGRAAPAGRAAGAAR